MPPIPAAPNDAKLGGRATIAGREWEGRAMRFSGKVALITAAASGIGRATAEIMAREGAVVVAVDIDQARLDDTAAALRAAGGQAQGRLADVLEPGQAERLATAVE